MSNFLQYQLLSYINHTISNQQDIDLLTYSQCDQTFKISDYINFDWKNILVHPPRNSSKETFQELIFISSLTKKRSQEQKKLIEMVDNDPSVGVKNICKKHNIIFPQKLFDKYYENTKNLIYAIKCQFNRPRPYQLAPFYNIDIDVIESKTADTPAYPSGHTVYARLAALIIGESYPLLANKLDYAVNGVAYARCLQGVHFPSDNKASIVVADTIFHYLNRLEV